ncbi:MAG TPA: hypothetical protein VK996_17675, partial [Ramlibacter sp.]|nr:hypothetical protein [Ramlibacter sp.]
MIWFTASRPHRNVDAPPVPSPVAKQERIDVIRSALLEVLDAVQTPDSRALMVRVLCADDAERLWYLRPHAMSVLASWQGEAVARQTLVRISVLFQDVLPEGLASQLRAVGKVTPLASRRLETFQETS